MVVNPIFTMSALPEFLWPVLAYLFGSISSAVIISKVFSLPDPRSTGSGNPGATNVLRTGGKVPAALTLVGDFAKGLIPVLLAQTADVSNGVLALVAIAAFSGHLYPLFFNFKGGKGVATTLGVFAALNWVLIATFIGVWIMVAALFRYSSLASLLATAICGVASFAIFNQQHELQLIGAVFWIVAFTFQRHRDNIDRLKNGKESKIGQKKPPAK